MARPYVQFPTPGKRRRGKSWQVFWRAGGSVYGVTVDANDEASAEHCRLQVAMALRDDQWPAWALDAPSVRRYRRTLRPAPDEGDLLAGYEPSLRGEVAANWASTCLGHLRELRSHAGKPLGQVTAQDAQAFLDHVLRTPGAFRTGRGVRGVATRNRARTACSRFYRWAVDTGRVAGSPFAATRHLHEAPPGEIVYLVRAERDRVLEAANGLPDGNAVWLAVYAGLRRSEVARCAWADVALDRGRLIVRRGKTDVRTLPLSAPLMERLKAAKPTRLGRRTASIVPWPASEPQWQYRAGMLLGALRAACPDVAAERIRWNAFRHTFGSLLAQAGVSLDKISAWMGNSPTICRRHYAEFVPRDRRDEEIDLL